MWPCDISLEMFSSISNGSTTSNMFNAKTKSNFFFWNGWFKTSATKKSEFSNDFFLACNVAKNDWSIEKIFLCFFLRKFEIIPIDEPNSKTLSYDGKSLSVFFYNWIKRRVSTWHVYFSPLLFYYRVIIVRFFYIS